MLYTARLRHIAGTKWGIKKYRDMDLLKTQVVGNEASKLSCNRRTAQWKKRKSTDTTVGYNRSNDCA